MILNSYVRKWELTNLISVIKKTSSKRDKNNYLTCYLKAKLVKIIKAEFYNLKNYNS